MKFRRNLKKQHVSYYILYLCRVKCVIFCLSIGDFNIYHHIVYVQYFACQSIILTICLYCVLTIQCFWHINLMFYNMFIFFSPIIVLFIYLRMIIIPSNIIPKNIFKFWNIWFHHINRNVMMITIIIPSNIILKNVIEFWKFGFDHINRNAPVIVRPAKLTRFEPSHYWGGRPRGNSVVLNFFSFIIFILVKIPNGCFKN